MVYLSLVSGRFGCKRCIPILKLKKVSGVEALRCPGKPKAAIAEKVKTIYFLEILFWKKVEYLIYQVPYSIQEK